MHVNDIIDGESFIRWLSERPKETQGPEARIIGLRTALRVIPLVTLDKHKEKDDANALKAEIYNVLRINVLARAIVCADGRTRIGLIETTQLAIQKATKATIHTAGGIAIHSASNSAISAIFSILSSLPATKTTSRSISYSARAVSSALLAFQSIVPNIHSAIWRAIQEDAFEINEAGYNSLLTLPLWPASVPLPSRLTDPELFRIELKNTTNGHVWMRWYDRMLSGRAVSMEEEMLYGDEALDDLWDRPDGYLRVSAWLAEKLAELDTRQQELIGVPGTPTTPDEVETLPDISQFGSPVAFRKPDGKIGIRRNPIYDAIDLGEDGLELVHAQQANIRVFLAGLPTQAPEFLRLALVEYQAALPVDGKGGMALTLDIQASSILREVKSKAAQEWMNDGILIVSKSYAKLHPKISKLARNNKKRGKVLLETAFDEEKANSPKITHTLKQLADEADKRFEIELAELLRKDIATLHALPDIMPGDRPVPHDVSPKKRFWFARFGFFNSLQGLGAGTTIAKDGAGAVDQLSTFAKALWQLVKGLFGP